MGSKGEGREEKEEGRDKEVRRKGEGWEKKDVRKGEGMKKEGGRRGKEERRNFLLVYYALSFIHFYLFL